MHQPYLALWHPSIPLIVIGKSIKNRNVQKISIRHHIILQQEASHMIITKCTGCHLASDQFSHRVECIIDVPHIFTKLKKASPNFIRDNGLASTTTVLMTNENQILLELATCYDLNRDVRLVSSPDNPSFLEFFDKSSAIPDLANATSSFINNFNLSFYTDGSLSNLASQDVSMGIGWVQSDSYAPYIEFNAKVTGWLSSTRAETMVILSALITCPRSSTVKIFMDSQCCLDIFKRVTSSFTTSRHF